MIGDEKRSLSAVPAHDEVYDDTPAVPRIPPMIALSAKIFNERITVKFSRNRYEISEKPTYTSVTTINNFRITNKDVGNFSDTENFLPPCFHDTDTPTSSDSEDMPPRSRSPMFDIDSPSSSKSASAKSKEYYECEYCTRTCKKWPRMLKHKRRRHTSCANFSCKWCSRVFPNRSGWSYHMNSVHENYKPFACNFCDKKFVTKRQLELHSKQHENICHFCLNTFATKIKLKAHKDRMHRAYKCEFCDIKGFFREHRLLKHIETCHPHVAQKQSQEEEQRLHTPDEQEPIFESPPLTPEEEYEQEEEEKEKDVKPEVCKYCGKLFACEEDLHQHWKLTGENLHICVYCLHVSENELAFSHHLLNHNEEKIFVCTLCSKTFVTMDLLEDHFTTHAELSI